MSRAVKQTKPVQSATELAARTVQNWFDTLVSDLDAINDNHSFGDGGFLPDVDLDAVKTAIRGTTPTPDDDDADLDQIAEVKAAYLIGVQMGLRLRGGAR